MTKDDIIRTYGSLSLAYVGDAAYELAVREYLLTKNASGNGALHTAAKTFVSARAQSAFLEQLTPLLTEEELAVVRRGRNVKCHSHPKNADLAEYHSATGFEALWGFLYLAGDTERLSYLLERIVHTIGE